MNSYLLTNRCTRTRVKTADNHTLKVFSVFYQHPALIHPDGWHLLKHDKENILVDENTLYILNKHECEFGFQPKSGTILTCKITIKGKLSDEESKSHWDDIYKYCIEVKRDFAKFCDDNKVEELTNKLSSSLGLQDSVEIDQVPEKTPAKKDQTPQNKSDGD